MKTFKVTFRKKSSKNSQEILKTVIVENYNNNDSGIILSGCIIALGEGFKYNSRKHIASFEKI